MAAFTAKVLSASANGRPIPVAATASPGTAVHTAATGGIDELYVYAHNVTASPVVLTIQFGGVTTGDQMTYSIPANGNVQVLFGERLSGGLAVLAYASAANAVNLTGAVNNIL